MKNIIFAQKCSFCNKYHIWSTIDACLFSTICHIWPMKLIFVLPWYISYLCWFIFCVYSYLCAYFVLGVSCIAPMKYHVNSLAYLIYTAIGLHICHIWCDVYSILVFTIWMSYLTCCFFTQSYLHTPISYLISIFGWFHICWEGIPIFANRHSLYESGWYLSW